MMTREQLLCEVRRVLAKEFELDPAKIVPDATLYEDLGLDSLDAVDIVVVLQKTFGIRLDDENALRALRTVDDILDFLEKMGADR